MPGTGPRTLHKEDEGNLMRVLLTRPQMQCEELGAVLKSSGIEWLGEPLLSMVPVEWDPGVLTEGHAVLLTSANASRELLRIAGVRRDLPIFAVGRATAAGLLAGGFTNVQIAEGTAVSLIADVRQKLDPQAGRLIYLSGYDVSVDLAAALASFGYSVDRSVVYRALAAERLSARTRHELSWNRVDGAVFLSARTAAVFCDLITAADMVSTCSRMTAFVISEQVAQALRSAGFGQVVVAASPCIRSVIDCILRIDETSLAESSLA